LKSNFFSLIIKKIKYLSKKYHKLLFDKRRYEILVLNTRDLKSLKDSRLD